MSWVTEENDGTFTGITIPKGWVPDPDIDHIEFTPYTCKEHTPIAGMMHVHAEDLDTVAANRARFGDQPVECNDCDAVYTVAKGWHHQ